jgi:hypothetical protein
MFTVDNPNAEDQSAVVTLSAVLEWSPWQT